jgi:hypothetical protein
MSRDPDSPQRATGRGGWPLVPSKRWAREMTIACPTCGSTNVRFSCRYPARGTGQGGVGRLGDPGTMETNECLDCQTFAAFKP